MPVYPVRRSHPGADSLGGILSGSASLFITAWAMPYILFYLVIAVFNIGLGLGGNVVTLIVFVNSVLLLIAIARYSTLYPVIVDGETLSLRTAKQRARTGPLFFRFIGIILCGIAASIASIIAVFIILNATGASRSAALDLIGSLSFSAISVICLVATVAVLCNAYSVLRKR